MIYLLEKTSLRKVLLTFQKEKIHMLEDLKSLRILKVKSGSGGVAAGWGLGAEPSIRVLGGPQQGPGAEP